jgi:hypothetical protein
MPRGDIDATLASSGIEKRRAPTVSKDTAMADSLATR